MNRELQRLTLAVLVGFVVVALASAYWAVVQAGGILDRDDNLRTVIAEQRIQRGAIVDQNGIVLAESAIQDDGTVRRVYPYPEAAGAVGYYSYTYGTAGIENAYNGILRGDETGSDLDTLIDEALHRAPEGMDVRSTLDLNVQLAVSNALEAEDSAGGAVVVVDVPSGRVLAMVSAPSFDPNDLDTQWDALRADEVTSPLLNRVLGGVYQPGGALQTVLLSAILASETDLTARGPEILNTEAPDATAPVQVNGLTLTCLDDVPEEPLSLAEAYAHGCPQPFVAALDGTLTPERLWERLQVLGFLAPAELAGLTTGIGAPADMLTAATPLDTLVAAVTGQSDLTVTPLQMVELVSAIAGQGNGVPLHLVDAVRAPDSEVWEPVETPTRHPALLRPDVASALRLAMLQAAGESSYVAQALRGELVLYGHSAMAYGGPDATPYAWFLGFVDQPEGAGGSAVAVVVVLENEPDPGAAARVAGSAFEAAVQRYTAEGE